jgi:lysozyme
MTPRHRVSPAAIELIKRFEGYRRKAAQLPDGRWTIGHGHTQSARQGAEVSEADAEALLIYDLIAVTHTLDEQVFTPLSQNQFDALASFTFNIGVESFSRSGVLRRLNEGALLQAACAMELWRKADVGGELIVVDALVRRRSAEKILFLTPPDGDWVAAPSPVLRPLLDTDAGGIIPRETPATVTTALNGERVTLLREGAPTPPPVPPEDEVSPAKVAAEAVSARLQTLFQQPSEEPAPEVADSPWRAEGDGSPEEEPFMLTSQIAGEDGPTMNEPTFREAADEPRGPDLFDTSEPTSGLHNQASPSRSAFTPLEGPAYEPRSFEPQSFEPQPLERRTFETRTFETRSFEPQALEAQFEAIEPFEFLKPTAQPLPEQPKAGLFALLFLALAGLAFFAGGVFWATNARPVVGPAWLDPRLVGWLAGAAGVGFFAVAIYLLLQRLGRTSEQAGRGRRY